VTEAVYGMAEAERQIRVARALYEATGAKKPWNKLRLKERRPFIDRSCHGAYASNDDLFEPPLEFQAATESPNSKAGAARPLPADSACPVAPGRATS
jgi:hypothetical protein